MFTNLKRKQQLFAESRERKRERCGKRKEDREAGGRQGGHNRIQNIPEEGKGKRALEKDMGTEQDPDKGRETQELWRELCVCAEVVMISSATFLNIAEH